MERLIGFFLLLFVVFFGWKNEVFKTREVVATVESCSAIITPTTMQTSSQADFSVSITNTSQQDIVYFEISAPNANWSIQGKNLSGWTSTANSSKAQFWGGSIPPGGSVTPVLIVVSGAIEVANSNWVVAVNDVLSTDGIVSCTGSLTTNISGVADVVAPVLSETISVSDVSATAATVTWTTNEAVTSVIYYGTTANFGSEASVTTSSTSQSVTLSGLSANTTYYFYVVVRDESGNSAESSEAVFTTAQAGLEGTTTVVTVSNTVTTIKTETVTKILTDTTPPVLTVKQNEESVFESAPLIVGSVSDDRGVARVEYSMDGGPWLTAGIDGGVGDKKTTWEFVPSLSLDGTYEIKVRGVDVFDNKSAPKIVKFVIDRLPPTVGGAVFSIGGVVLGARDGTIYGLENTKLTGVFKELGGSETIKVVVGGKEFAAFKDKSTSVWSIDLVLDKGVYSSRIVAVDGAGKVVERDWLRFDIAPKIKIFMQDEEVKLEKIELWRKNSYGVFVKWDKGESVGWVVPPGKYYINALVSGKKYVSQVLEFDSFPGVISGEWNLGKEVWWSKFLPAGRPIKVYEGSKSETSNVLDTSLLPSRWYGSNRIIYVMNPDLPFATEGLMLVRQEARSTGFDLVVVGLQASQQEMEIWMDRKTEDFLSDWEGSWLQDGKLMVLPTKYYLDTFGKMVKVKEGVY